MQVSQVTKTSYLRWVAALLLAIATLGVYAQSPTKEQWALQPIASDTARDFKKRIPGCSAEIFAIPKRELVAQVSGASWVLIQKDMKANELPVLFRDKGAKGPELQFGAVSEDLGGLVEGALTMPESSTACSAEGNCQETNAQLKLRVTSLTGKHHDAFLGPVVVVDQCGGDKRKRIFYVTPWWSKILGNIFGH